MATTTKAKTTKTAAPKATFREGGLPVKSTALAPAKTKVAKVTPDELASTKGLLAAAEATVESLGTQLAEANQKLALADSAYKSVNAQRTGLEASLESYRTDHTNKAKRIAELLEDKQALKDTLAMEKVSVERLLGDVKRLEEQKADLMATIDGKDRMLVNRQQELDKFRQQSGECLHIAEREMLSQRSRASFAMSERDDLKSELSKIPSFLRKLFGVNS